MQEMVIDFVNVTQQAAMAAYSFIGKGNKNKADGASTESMRYQLNLMNMDGLVVIGEGEMDEAPMLFIGERVGSGHGPQLDIAVDPIDGTNSVAKGRENSIAVIAAAEKGCLLHAPDMYMKKIAVGPRAAGKVDIDAPITENMKTVSKALNKEISDLCIMVQERERHKELIDQIQKAGASVKLFSDVDITGVIATSIEEFEVDMLVGIGGAPEGVVAATALKCLGGDFQGKLLPKNEGEYNRCIEMGLKDPRKKLTLNDIVKSNNCLFAATGITDGMLLKGVRKTGSHSMSTHSFVSFGNSQYHFIKSVHVQNPHCDSLAT